MEAKGVSGVDYRRRLWGWGLGEAGLRKSLVLLGEPSPAGWKEAPAGLGT